MYFIFWVELFFAGVSKLIKKKKSEKRKKRKKEKLSVIFAQAFSIS